MVGLLFVLNRSFFMNLFFMISGYLLPAAYDRKGAAAFLKDHFLRLGIPMLDFGWVLLLGIPPQLWRKQLD
jgi:glucan biosynthesis protein C